MDLKRGFVRVGGKKGQAGYQRQGRTIIDSARATVKQETAKKAEKGDSVVIRVTMRLVAGWSVKRWGIDAVDTSASPALLAALLRRLGGVEPGLFDLVLDLWGSMASLRVVKGTNGEVGLFHLSRSLSYSSEFMKWNAMRFTLTVQLPNLPGKYGGRVTGQVLSLMVTLSKPVSEIKAMVAAQTGMPPGRMVFTSRRGVGMYNINELAFYNICVVNPIIITESPPRRGRAEPS